MSGQAMASDGTGFTVNANINYYWRLVATGICFVTFGLGALTMVVVIFPLIRLFAKANKAKYSRWIIHKGFAAFLWFMQTSGVLKFEIKGSEKLRDCRNVLVLANHPTLIDVIAIVAHMPYASCIVKRALWDNFFVGGVVRAAEYISNSDPDNLIQDCAADLRAGNPLLIFPEGTRSTPNKALKFKRGAAHMALHSNVAIMPIVIRCQPSTLTKGEKWYTIPPKKAHLLIEVFESISINTLVDTQDSSQISARQLTNTLERHFTEAIKKHGSVTA